MDISALLAKLNKLPRGMILEKQRFGRSQAASVWIEAGRVLEIGAFLKSNEDFELDWLENISVAQLDRAFVVSYFLRSRRTGIAVVLRSSTEAPNERDAEVTLPSVQDCWESAAPFESEIQDLFGIRFTGAATNKSSLFMSGLSGDKGFGGFPLRKDYAAPVFARGGVQE